MRHAVRHRRDRFVAEVIVEQLDATHSNVGASATEVTVLAANLLRKGASIHNDSTAICYLKMGTGASTTSFTVKLQADDHYELPRWGLGHDVYRGVITALWASATGSARVTEYT